MTIPHHPSLSKLSMTCGKNHLSSLGIIGEVVTTKTFDSEKDQGYNDI
jgi:hypothetical protein